MHCVNCGQVNTHQAKFCAECGQTISREFAAVPAPEQPLGTMATETADGRAANRRRRLFLGMVSVGLLMLVVLILAVSKDTDSAPQHPSISANKAATLPLSPLPKPKTQAQLLKEAADNESLDETTRVAAAKVMENSLLDKGLDVDVNATGIHHKTLRLKWILVSKVTAYQFARDGGETFANLKDAGFTKLVITDGYDESWSWNLSR